MTKRNGSPEWEAHLRPCVGRNRRRALLAFLFSAALLLASWRELGKPFLAECDPLSVRLGLLYVVGLMVYFFLSVRCKRERLWLALALSSGLVILVKGFFPTVVEGVVTGVRAFLVLVWVAATFVSLSLVRSAFQPPPRDAGPQALNSEKDKQ